MRRNIFPIPKYDTYCIIISSHFFFIPAYIAYTKGLYLYSATSGITAIVSVNYWRHAVPGFRRNLDLYFSKFAFAVYFVSGVSELSCVISPITNQSSYNKTIGYTNLLGILACYSLSNYCWNKDYQMWVYFHMLFHFFTAYEQYNVYSGLCK